MWSVFIDPKRAPHNPWSSLGLEWKTPTPVPSYNFAHIPVVLADPYHYGEPNVVSVADLGVPEPAMAGVSAAPPGGPHG